MSDYSRPLLPTLTLVLLAAVLWAVPIMALAGCAVGRDQLSGDIVLGFKAGRLVETANQAGFAAAEAAGTLLGGGPLGQLAGFGLTAALGHFAGRNRGWDEREQHEKNKGNA